MPQLTLTLLPEHFKILQFPPETPLPAFPRGSFVTVTVNAEEVSIVCPQNVELDAPQVSLDWRCFKFEGPFAFDQTGILNAVTGPLAVAGVGIFAVSTYNTDYLMVKSHQLEVTIDALRQAGHQV
ncbi:ACT domain-containing protein [Deinococcus cellulosilyticus]|uniref:ACT domain-containing protein n=1 Tax=Deinococcus cellulosilyticus (strain DSM 18568 / NBRC 106333 / KACC 11606 / 5516J-15) TaxID=1223518 RepID=A0A511MWU6_DEIC1|nr:ACT domain-containing protein [Deinococcus cellulosilyticus]GEM44647.1 ACT domain-containing protein [Deinococcus cellulosilyticus NBRC 106333 = KACC 11606]